MFRLIGRKIFFFMPALLFQISPLTSNVLLLHSLFSPAS